MKQEVPRERDGLRYQGEDENSIDASAGMDGGGTNGCMGGERGWGKTGALKGLGIPE